MARPKRSKATPAEKKPPAQKQDAAVIDPETQDQAPDEATETSDETDERDAELKALRELVAAGQLATDKLKEDLKAANVRADEAHVSNEDFREKPPPGELWYYLVRFDP